MSKGSLLAKKISEEVMPCDDCSKRERCASLQLTCPDYSVWLESGRCVNERRTPTAKGYDKHYPGNNLGELIA